MMNLKTMKDRAPFGKALSLGLPPCCIFRMISAMVRYLFLSCCIGIALLGGSASAMYENNSEESLQLVQQAKEDDKEAMEKLGDLYRTGAGVKADRTEALIWYSFAADLGNTSARKKLWKLEGHDKQELPQVKRPKTYHKKVTEEFCRYLYMATGSLTRLYPQSDLPPGIPLRPSPDPTRFYAPELSPALVKKYLSRGADPNASLSVEELQLSNKQGHFLVNPLKLLLLSGDYKSLDLLLAAGACLHDANLSVLNLALNQMQLGSMKSIAYLAERGYDFNVRNRRTSGTAYLFRIGLDHAEGIEKLAALGCNPNTPLDSRYVKGRGVPAFDGEPPLFTAVRSKRINATDALIRSGSDLTTVVSGKTVLDVAREAKGADDQASRTYNEELNRLRKIAYDQESSASTHTGITAMGATSIDLLNSQPPAPAVKTGTRRISLAHLLRLAGARSAGEQHANGKH